MKTNIYALGLVLATLAQQAFAQGNIDRHTQKTLLKNWAISRCLGQVYADATTKDDANATAGAYLEAGRQPVEAYEALGVLVSKYANRKYDGAVASEFNTMKCIDLLNSKELDELAGKLAKRK